MKKSPFIAAMEAERGPKQDWPARKLSAKFGVPNAACAR